MIPLNEHTRDEGEISWSQNTLELTKRMRGGGRIEGTIRQLEIGNK